MEAPVVRTKFFKSLKYYARLLVTSTRSHIFAFETTQLNMLTRCL